MTDATAAPVPTAKPGAEDLFEIFYAPSKVFDRRRGGEYGLPLVVLAVMAGVLIVATKGLMQPVFDAEQTAQMAKATAKMTPEQAEQVRASAAKFSGAAAIIFTPIAFLIIPFVLGFFAWIAAKLVGVKQGYGLAVMIATFAYFPRLLEWIVSAVQLAVMPNIPITSKLSLSLGVGRFLDGSHPTLATALLGRVDIFTLWVTFLIGLGFMVTARATRNQAIAIGVMVWIVGALPPLFAALR